MSSESARRVRAYALPLIAAWVSGLELFALPTPHGDPFQLNSYVTGDQRAVAIAATPDGGFVATWSSEGSNGSDTSSSSVQARRFTRFALPVGPQFQVNTYTPNQQIRPAVAVTPDGGFVIAWASLGSFGTDQELTSIQFQRFQADGTPVGSEVQVNEYTTDLQGKPAVAADAAGRFVVVWYSFGSNGSDTSDASIQARRFAADATPLGGEFQVNTYTTAWQYVAAVAMAADGGFVVVWDSQGSDGGDASSWSIQGQRFTVDGNPDGAEFQVNTHTTGTQRYPTVAMEATGRFVVAWHSLGSSGPDQDGYSVQAREFAPDGTPSSGEWLVNGYTTDGQVNARIAADPAGGFVVTWRRDDGLTLGESIQARRFSDAGVPATADFQINVLDTGAQDLPTVAVDRDGNFVVAWESEVSAGSDTDGSSIQARIYDALFRDGFESGATDRWSPTGP